MNIDPSVAWDKIKCMETSKEIAEFLESQGIKAVPGSYYGCALAEWLTRMTGEHAVVTGEIAIGQYNKPRVKFDHTYATLDFIDDFDNGEFPELVVEY